MTWLRFSASDLHVVLQISIMTNISGVYGQGCALYSYNAILFKNLQIYCASVSPKYFFLAFVFYNSQVSYTPLSSGKSKWNYFTSFKKLHISNYESSSNHRCEWKKKKIKLKKSCHSHIIALECPLYLPHLIPVLLSGYRTACTSVLLFPGKSHTVGLSHNRKSIFFFN